MVYVGVGNLTNIKRVEVSDTDSIKSAFSTGGYSVPETQEIQDLEGTVYDGSESVESGKTYILRERVKSGSQ
jgi:hypothetical protein